MPIVITLIVVAGLVGIDQGIKVLVSNALAPHGAVTVIPGVVEFRYVENTGAAFSMLEGQQVLLIILTSVVLVVVAALLVFRRPKDKLEYAAFVMILAGGIGNLINRIADGYVVDYINLLFMRFAVFNFADCLVSIGFVLLIIAVFRGEHKRKKLEKLQAEMAQGPGGADADATDRTQEVRAGGPDIVYNELEPDVAGAGSLPAGKPEPARPDGEN